MENVIIGSHNTMTYLQPKNFLFYLAYLLVAKCQSKDYMYHYSKGVRAFDIRIYWGDNNWQYAHGLINLHLKEGIFSLLRKLNNLAIKDEERIYVRIILEKIFDDFDRTKFMDFCSFIEREFMHLTFFGGNSKKGWEKLYTFNSGIGDEDVHQWVSSMAEDARWYEKFMPWAYALRKNSENFSLAKEGINLYDFIK